MVRENIKLRKSNSMVAQVHAINTLLNSVKGSKLSKLPSWQSHGALTAFMCLCGSEVPWRINQGLDPQGQGQGQQHCFLLYSVNLILFTLLLIHLIPQTMAPLLSLSAVLPPNMIYTIARAHSTCEHIIGWVLAVIQFALQSLHC